MNFNSKSTDFCINKDPMEEPGSIVTNHLYQISLSAFIAWSCRFLFVVNGEVNHTVLVEIHIAYHVVISKWF